MLGKTGYNSPFPSTKLSGSKGVDGLIYEPGGEFGGAMVEVLWGADFGVRGRGVHQFVMPESGV